MNNSYLILFTFMLTVSKRLQLKTTINNMNLQYPYDVLWAEIKDIKEDLTKEDFLEIVKELLDAENYLFFKEMPFLFTTKQITYILHLVLSKNPIHLQNLIF